MEQFLLSLFFLFRMVCDSICLLTKPKHLESTLLCKRDSNFHGRDYTKNLAAGANDHIAFPGQMALRLIPVPASIPN